MCCCSSVRTTCTEVNHNKFVVYTCLLLFAICWALKLDGAIGVSFWWVFLPLFVWKALMFVGCFTGCFVWCVSPQLRENRTEFHSMWLSCVLHSQLLLFELLCCLKLEQSSTDGDDTPYSSPLLNFSWFTVFLPLLLSTPFSFFYFWWLYKHDRSFVLELLHGSNVLFFIFVTIKLDGMVDWSWALVFVPMWMLMCVLCFVLVYCTFWSLFLLRQMGQHVSPEQKSYYIRLISTSLVLLCPLLAFLVLLVSKLESTWDMFANEERQRVNMLSDLEYQFDLPSIRRQSSDSSSNSLDNSMYTQDANPNSQFIQPVQRHYQTAGIPWIVTMAPSYITLLALITSTLGSRGGNRWIFGMRTDLFTFATKLFPCLKEYANISFKRGPSAAQNPSGERQPHANSSWTARSQMLFNLRLASSTEPAVLHIVRDEPSPYLEVSVSNRPGQQTANNNVSGVLESVQWRGDASSAVVLVSTSSSNNINSSMHADPAENDDACNMPSDYSVTLESHHVMVASSMDTSSSSNPVSYDTETPPPTCQSNAPRNSSTTATTCPDSHHNQIEISPSVQEQPSLNLSRIHGSQPSRRGMRNPSSSSFQLRLLSIRHHLGKLSRFRRRRNSNDAVVQLQPPSIKLVTCSADICQCQCQGAIVGSSSTEKEHDVICDRCLSFYAIPRDIQTGMQLMIDVPD